MRNIILVLTLFLTTTIFPQNEVAIQKEIDRSLWQPFKIAFETLDAEKLNGLYAQQVLRVTPNGIDTENTFKGANQKRFEVNSAKKVSIQLDFWFDSRHTNLYTSYEVGFYRMKLIDDERSDTIYGQFHIVLRKIDGYWRITQDWDTDTINGKPLTKMDFEKQPPLKFE